MTEKIALGIVPTISIVLLPVETAQSVERLSVPKGVRYLFGVGGV